MAMTEENGYGEQMAAEHGRPRLKKKRLTVAAVVSVAALFLLVIVWMRRDSDVNSVLSGAGFAGLPASARNVKMDTQGSLFDRRVTLVRFDADPQDMRQFIERSTIVSPPRFSGVMDMRDVSVVYPSWWPKRGESYGERTYFVSAGRYGGLATVGNEMCTIYIHLTSHTRLLSRIKRYVPFI